MRNPIEALLGWLDRRSEAASRRTAQTSGRRSFLARLGAAMVGGAVLPILPFDRTFGQAMAQSSDGNPYSCNYWRYCALDGYICSACGGTTTDCPPGSTPSQVSWIGTCRNPRDGQDYLVSYNDCCGKTSCNTTFCFGNEGERPGYRMGLNNDINWCMANESRGYHCTVAVLVGIAD